MLTDNLTLLLGLAALIGLLIGSFLNVVIHRLPIMLQKWDTPQEQDRNFSLVMPASHCPHCKTPLQISHNIPIISYLMLQGRCKFCNAAINLRYPLVEIIATLAAIIVALKLGPNIETLAGLGLTWALIVPRLY